MRLSGLRRRMAVSYVLVTAAAVVLVDGIVLGLLLPRMLTSSNHASRAAVARQAGADAKRLSEGAVNIAGKMPPGTTRTQLMRILASSTEAHALRLTASGGTTAVPERQCLSARSAEALVLPDGRWSRVPTVSPAPLGCASAMLVTQDQRAREFSKHPTARSSGRSAG